MNKFYICIEGASGSGKSTLIENITKKFPEFIKSPVVKDFIGGTHPNLPISEIDIKSGFELYINGYIKKTEAILENPKNGFWILDRNWISQVTFLLCIGKLTHFEISEFIDQIIELINSDKLIVPDLYIYTKCPPSISGKRRIKRGSSKWGDTPKGLSNVSKFDFRLNRYNFYNLFFNDFPQKIIIFDSTKIQNTEKTLRKLSDAITSVSIDRDKKKKMVSHLVKMKTGDNKV